MELTIGHYIKAAYPFLFIPTHEEQRVVRTIKEQAPDYSIFTWDLVNGTREFQEDGERDMEPRLNLDYDLLDPIRFIASADELTILIVFDFHRFINNPEIYRSIKRIAPILKSSGKHLIFVSPVQTIPVELEKEITIVPFDLPSVDSLMERALNITEENNLSIPVRRGVISSAKGLTLNEAENAFALSLTLSGRFTKEILQNEKIQSVRKGRLLEIYDPQPESILGGLTNLKRYIHARKKGFAYRSRLPVPKGILLVGVPGAGKSLAARVIATILGFPLIRLDMAMLKSGLVGESEQNTRMALATIDAVSPCVVWMN